MERHDSRLNIAIIEDNELDSVLLEKKIKEKLDYDTKVYTSIDPLFKYIDDKNDIDVIILDNELGDKDKDSLNTLQKIKKRSPMAEVIVLSKRPEKSFAEQLIGAGAYEHVYKDRMAVDKIVNHIENIKNNWKLRRENLNLQMRARKRQNAVVALIFVLLVILGLAAYMLFIKK